MAATLTPSRDHTLTASIPPPSPTRHQHQQQQYQHQQLPNPDFSFTTLRSQMKSFTTRFDAYIASGRARVLAERNTFRLQAGELAETQRSTANRVADVRRDRVAHEVLLEREEAERKELADAVAGLSAERDKALLERERVVGLVERARREIGELRAEVGRMVRAREEQGLRNGPEVRFWERSLALRIEGVDAGSHRRGGGGGGGEGVSEHGTVKRRGGVKNEDEEEEEEKEQNRVRFVLGCVDERNGNEGAFVLDMGGDEFRVVETAPVLDEDRVLDVVSRFNAGGTLSDLLKGMRGLIVAAFAGN